MSRDITPDDLEEIIRGSLIKQGFSLDYVRGYLVAMGLAGWTRPNCPAWIRNSAAAHYLLTPQDVGTEEIVDGRPSGDLDQRD